jgi:cell division protein FtsQ
VSTSTLERGTEGQRQRAPIDPRIAARRRQVARDVGKRRRTRLIAFALVLVAIAAVVGLIRSPLLDLDRFQVTESRHVTSDEIIDASGVKPGDALALIDAGEVRASLLALPWVADASVSVSWPDALRLAVTERVPVATVAVPPATSGQVTSGLAWMLVDAEGRVLGPATVAPSDDANGPVLIEGITVPAPGGTLDQAGQDALDVVAGLSPGVRTRVDAVVVGADGQVTLRLRPEMVALVGPIADLDQKLMALQTTLAQVDLTDIESIDLRVPGRVDVKRRQPVVPASTSGTGATGRGTGGTSGAG